MWRIKREAKLEDLKYVCVCTTYTYICIHTDTFGPFFILQAHIVQQASIELASLTHSPQTPAQ